MTKYRSFVTFIICIVVLAAFQLGFMLTSNAQSVSPSCSAPNYIAWPSNNPVWKLCWRSPSNSSGVNGSGLELTNVYYKDKKVFSRAHIPVLNVRYDPGGCGGSNLSYRDWTNELQAFEANNRISSGYAEPTTPPITVCNHPGTDEGRFAGVAAEKLADRLILTSQMRAGWYRYTQTWSFYQNGTIEPRFSFSAVEYPCVSRPHIHHAYWRFDFDIDDGNNDVVENVGTSLPITTETSVTRTNPNNASDRWRIRNKFSNRGYEIIDGSGDGTADSWAVGDRWVLRYNRSERDDGGSTSGDFGDSIHINDYLTGQNVNGQDLVVWYRGGHRHVTPSECVTVGPTLRAIGTW
jgi:hypothetical protein